MKKEKMQKLNEWAKGKPLGLVMVAQQFTVGAEPCFQFLKREDLRDTSLILL